MIYYFSGTGNSRYVAQSLAADLGDKAVQVGEFEDKQISTVASHGFTGLVFPVYSWGVPPLILDFIEKLSCSETFRKAGNSLWVVMTCGDETAMAPEMLCKKASRCGIDIKGIWSVIMPNNYVLLPGFSVDPKAVELKKLKEAPERIRKIAEHIRNKEWTVDVTRGSWPRLKTRLVYPLFKRWGISPRKWKSGSGCIGCGRCAAVCSVSNIDMQSGRPEWGRDCVSCVACYHICPVRAIDYGNITKGKGQYYCPCLASR